MFDRRQTLLGLSAGLAQTALFSTSHALAGQHAGAEGNLIRAFEVGDQKGVETLRISERPMPNPRPGEVLIRVQASSINARDFGIVAGNFFGRKPPERIPLAEGAGEIAALGSGVSGFSVGDRVTVNHLPDWEDGLWDVQYYARDIGNTLDGWLADYVLMPAKALVLLPASVSYETAATLASSGLTAWQGLFEVRPVQPGDIVLTLGTGGVSIWGLLLAKVAGATVVITSSSDEKLDRAKQLGADVTINYKKNPEWAKEVYEKTDGHGADLILETVGRVNIDQSMPAAASAGTVVLIGTRPSPKTGPLMKDLFMRNLTLRAISVGSTRMFQDLVAFIDDKKLEPVISQTFAFDQTKDAFAHMNAPGRMGKVIIKHI